MNDTTSILEKQVQRLPREVLEYIDKDNWRAELVAIGLDNGLDSTTTEALRREILLVLMGLIHPEEFREELRKDLHLDKGVLARLVPEIEARILAPVHTTLTDFYQEQLGEPEATQEETAEEISVEEAAPKIPLKQRMPAPPENLPTGDGIPEIQEPPAPAFIPELTPKPIETTPEPAHPFEEKMKKVFTGTPASHTDLKIEAPTTPSAPKAADPYREIVE